LQTSFPGSAVFTPGASIYTLPDTTSDGINGVKQQYQPHAAGLEKRS